MADPLPASRRQTEHDCPNKAHDQEARPSHGQGCDAMERGPARSRDSCRQKRGDKNSECQDCDHEDRNGCSWQCIRDEGRQHQCPYGEQRPNDLRDQDEARKAEPLSGSDATLIPTMHFSPRAPRHALASPCPQNTPDQRRGVSAIRPALPKQLPPKPRPVRCIWLFCGTSLLLDPKARDPRALRKVAGLLVDLTTEGHPESEVAEFHVVRLCFPAKDEG